MLNRFTKADAVLLSLAFLSLLYAEVLWFTGAKQDALFVGLWVPTILGFGIYLKLMKAKGK